MLRVRRREWSLLVGTYQALCGGGQEQGDYIRCLGTQNEEEKVGTFRGGLLSWSKGLESVSRIWKQEILVLHSMPCFKVRFYL